MKKKLIIVSCAVVAVVVVGVCLWQFVFKSTAAAGDPPVYVSPVSQAAAGGSLGLLDRYSGVIEPQKEIKVKKDSTKKVSKLNVTEGQTVKAGDVLFTYDAEELALTLEQARLELEGIGNSIDSINSNIEELKKQRDDAPSDQELSFTIQIQSAQLDVKNKEYERTQKSNEIDKLEKSINNADVKSEIDGVIKAINENPNDTENPYITILSTGNYRVKSVVSELNMYAISVGQKVIIRSRTDDTTWSGTIDNVDRENPVSQNNNGGMVVYGGDSGQSEKASKYNFYITLDSYDGLMLGQHVYVEPDYGQGEKKEGLWLPSYYIAGEDSPYVWVKGGGDKLEKRKVEIGEYDEATDTKQILSGLELTDSIAFPDETCKEGVPTTTEMPVDNNMGGETGGNAGMDAQPLPEGGDMPEGGEEPADDGNNAEFSEGGDADTAEPKVIGGVDGGAAVNGGGVAIIGGNTEAGS